MWPAVLQGGGYALGAAVTQASLRVGMVSGSALGGLVVAVLGVRAALLADAATFAASALLVRFWVRQRPAAAHAAAGRRSQFAEMAAGVRLVLGDRTLRTLMLLGCLVAFYVVPMVLAAPYAAGLHTSLPIPVSKGILFAPRAFGTALGAAVPVRPLPPP